MAFLQNRQMRLNTHSFPAHRGMHFSLLDYTSRPDDREVREGLSFALLKWYYVKLGHEKQKIEY